MTVSAMTIFMFIAFPLFTEVVFAAWWQKEMGWNNAEPGEKVLLTGVFCYATFPALILPAIDFIALSTNLFNAVYY